MKRRNLVALGIAAFAVVGVATIASASVQAELTGTWTVTIDTPQGAMENVWEIEQAGDSFSGIISNDMMGENAFEDGWVDGDKFGLDMYIDFQGQGIDISYEGTFTEDEMSGTLIAMGGEFMADFTGVRADGSR